MIEVRGLTKRYGEVTAVNDLSFDVMPGKVTGFLGPNGAGKTTTMRLILGLDYPNAGTARIDGKQYASLAYPMREVGALLDAKAVHGGRSAYNHLLCLAQTNNLPRKQVGEVLEMVGLTAVARKRAKGFSLGMSQRLGIAAAMLGDPAVLMFDEPVNGLDPEGILWIRNLMKTLAAEGRTVFVSSHLMSEMQNTADYLIVIGRGRLLANCTMKEFIARSSGQTVRVATPQADQLAKAVAEAGGSTVSGDNGTLIVSGLARRPGRRPRVRARRAAAGADRGRGIARGGLHGAHRRQRGVPGRGRRGPRPARESAAAAPATRRARAARRQRKELNMATTTRQAPLLPAPSGQAGFGGTLRSEFTKIGSVRSTYWTLLMLLAVSVGIGAAISAAVAGGWSQPPPPPPAPPDVYDATQVSLAALLILGQLVIVVLGALVLTAEYSTGMIRTSLIAMPRRIVLYAAKAVAFAAAALAVSLATAFTAFYLGQALLARSHHSAALAGPGVLRAVIGSALYITLCGLFAFAAAAIIRNTAATITAMIGLLFVIPALVNLLPWRNDLVRWLPSSAARAISATVGGQDPHLFSPWGQFAMFAVYTAVLLVVGGILFRKRDA